MSKNQSDYDLPQRGFHADLKYGHKGEALVTSFLDSLEAGAFEVKSDRYRNGRMCVETSQHPRRKMNEDGTQFWKPSGLAVTKAAWWVYVYTLDNNEGAFLIVSVKRLKRYIRKNKSRLKVMDFARMSDNPAKGYLLEPEDVMDMMINPAYDEVRTS
jgi:hypothetical protein